MHPILGYRGRLFVYLAAWLPGGLLLAGVVTLAGGVPWLEAVALAFPLSQIYAFICLAAWYPSRALAPSRSHLWGAITNHGLAALLSSAIWQLAGAAWAFVLSYLPLFKGAYENFTRQIPLFFAVGILLYLLAAAASYLHVAFETSRQAQRQALEAEKRQELAAKELELARSIQHRLLPPSEQEGPGFRLAARNLAARFVAGDFYDYFRLPDGTLRIAVADVAGKGIAASLIMATVKAILPLIAADRSVIATLRELNRKLADELAEREFVALALAGFDPRTGRLELANAGLPDPYLLRCEAGLATIEAPFPRLPLGLRREVDYGSVEVTLEPGDRVLLLTDGLPEAPVAPGEPLGYEALCGFLDHREGQPSVWLDRLLARLRDATLAEQDDDWTALILERLPDRY